jgi:hypothetical protein
MQGGMRYHELMNCEKVHTWKEQTVAYFEDICMDRLKKIIENELTTSRIEKGTSRIKLLRLDYSLLRLNKILNYVANTL